MSDIVKWKQEFDLLRKEQKRIDLDLINFVKYNK